MWVKGSMEECCFECDDGGGGGRAGGSVYVKPA